jgi:prepilin peptidase CpaA
MFRFDFADTITAAVLLAMVAVAAVSDIRRRKIPNWLTLGGMAGGLVLQTVLHGLAGLLHSAEGLALGFGVYLAFYCLRAMGAGDVKLMAAVGAIAGPALWFQMFVATSVTAGVLALGLSLATGRLRQTVWNMAYIVMELMHFRAPYFRHPELDVKHGRALKMPHALAIAAGVAACVLLPGARFNLSRLLA